MLSPVRESLIALHNRLRSLDAGKVATYIPELGLANPDDFAVCIATVDGYVYSVGDYDVPFTIQSISKPLVYGLALDDAGVETVTGTVGVEPSGEAFNAISLEQSTGRPRNPMINAGAIATASLVAGDTSSERMDRVMAMMSAYAGRKLGMDEGVYRSEKDTGHRNRAIAYLLRNAGILGEDVDEVVDRYFRQCSMLVTCKDLAVMAATLANNGTNPTTGKAAIAPEHVDKVLSIMSTCGMYDAAGAWVYRVGMPAKSGVAGGVLAVLPGQLGIGVFSPRLDDFGNSVRGVAVCEELSWEFGLHLLRPPVSPTSSVLTSHGLGETSSRRRRPEEETRVISTYGNGVRFLRLQGPLVLSTAEVALRRALEHTDDASTVVFDFSRVQLIDPAVCRLFAQFATLGAQEGRFVVFAGIPAGVTWGAQIRAAVDPLILDSCVRFFADPDRAIEWCEDRILREAGLSSTNATESPLAEHAMFASFTADEIALLTSAMEHIVALAGTYLIRMGEPSDAVYFLTGGTVSVTIPLGERSAFRLATMGPGVAFGELALMDNEPRSADITADTDVVCYRLATDDLDRIARECPDVRYKLMQNLARDLSGRLRRANTAIATLAS